MKTLSNKEKARLAIAMRAAEANTDYPNSSQRMGAVLVCSGRVISIGWNKWRNNPYHVPAPSGPHHAPEAASYHAEEDTLSRHQDATGGVLYVARAMSDNKPGLALPCSRCAPQIAAAGIKKVVFTASYDLSLGRSISTKKLLEYHEISGLVLSNP